MVSIRAKIKSRLEKFLEVDTSGYRRAILCIFIKVKKATIDELHEMLSSKYSVSRNTVASMVGYIHSKLGILRAHKESYKTPNSLPSKRRIYRSAYENCNFSKTSTESTA